MGSDDFIDFSNHSCSQHLYSLMQSRYWQAGRTLKDCVMMIMMMQKTVDLQMMGQGSGHWSLQHVQLTWYEDR